MNAIERHVRAGRGAEEQVGEWAGGRASTPSHRPRFLHCPLYHLLICLAIAISLAAFAPLRAHGAAHPYRGLWVGEAKLQHVNQVTVPLDAANVPIAPDPNVPTPTADKANLRLILHVNGAGQVTLLKGVALLSRTGGSNVALRAESDLALVTDERLYGEFPAQPAMRIASATFDFGDPAPTVILDALVGAAARAVTNPVAASSANLNTTAGRIAAENAARAAAIPAAQAIIASADVAAAFHSFLQTNMNAARVDAIAGASAPASTAASSRMAAIALRDASPYRDARAVEMIDAMLAAIAAETDAVAKTNAAQNMAAAFAETDNAYQRFIAGKLFGDMIASAALAAATEATNSAASTNSIRAAVNADAMVNDARQAALLMRVQQFRDGRAINAVEVVAEAIVQAAAATLSEPLRLRTAIAGATEQAGRDALANDVARYRVAALSPTLDYLAFVQSTLFQGSGALAADAAAKAGVFERKNNQLWTLASLQAAAKQAALVALRDAYAAAARAARPELLLSGLFGPGSGDSRLTWGIKQSNGSPLGAAGLTGVIQLPASHPTNPFRHRRHPDHVVGFVLKRHVRFDFDGTPGDALGRGGFGVQRISGTYREEIFGLHKPLGPDPKNAPVGLKVEGRFELNRVSLIDTLNAR